MQQAAEAAEFGEAPPPELEIAWQCERWHTLPDAGGYLDQDATLMHRMTIAANVYHVVIHLRSLVGDQIHSLSDPERRIIKVLLEEHIING